MTAPIRRRALPPSVAEAAKKKAAALAQGGFSTNPFLGVEWTPAFVGFLGYLFATITFKFPIGTVSMATALLTLPLEKKALRMPPVALCAIGLVAWSFVGVATTDYHESVLDAVNEFAKVCAVIFVGLNVITTRARLRLIVVYTTILWFFFPLRGTIVGYLGGNRLQGRALWNFIYSNSNDLAGLALLQLSVALSVLAVEHRWWVKLGTRVTVGTILVVIFLTQSRGAMIALIAFGLFLGRKFFFDARKLAMMAVMAVIIFLTAPERTWTRFATITTATSDDMSLLDPTEVDLLTRSDQGSSKSRREIWKVSMTIFSENPITGVGLGAYPLAHQITALRDGNLFARGRRDAHSTYLKMLAETGVIGFSLFMSIIGVTVYTARRARKRMAAAEPALSLQLFYLEMGLLGFLVAGIWGSYGSLVPTYVHITLVYSAAKLLDEEADVRAERMQRMRRAMSKPPRLNYRPMSTGA